MMQMAGIAVISAASAYVLDALGFGGTKLFIAFASVLILIGSLDGMYGIFEQLSQLSVPSIGKRITADALRVLGIGYVGGFFSDFCIQLGAKGVSDGLLIYTRVQMMAVIMPYLSDVLAVAGELFK